MSKLTLLVFSLVSTFSFSVMAQSSRTAPAANKYEKIQKMNQQGIGSLNHHCKGTSFDNDNPNFNPSGIAYNSSDCIQMQAADIQATGGNSGSQQQAQQQQSAY